MKIGSSRSVIASSFLVACTFAVTWIPFLLQPGRNDANCVPPFTYNGDVGPYLPGTSVIFYNAYFSPGNEKHGFRIVEEQLDQIARTDRQVTMYVNTIGSPVLSPMFLRNLCSARNITCQLLSHYRSANEDVTLQRLYDFCQDQDDDDDNDSLRVAYIHNKGSYNSHDGTNEIWRRHLTAAAMTKDCWNPPNATCHVCGLQFWPIWSTFFPGNMWTAQCSYVRKLLPPTGFDARMDSFHKTALQLQRQGIITNGVFPMSRKKGLDDFKKGLLGIERFAFEHWVGSHPDLRPCDVAGDMAGNLSAWIQSGNHSRNESDFVWSMAPHAPFRRLNYWWALSHSGSKVQQIMHHKGRRMKEYFLLPGLLHKWIYLYNQTPPASSWAFSWYPDRVIWRTRVEELGVKVLDTLQPRT